MTTLTNLPPAPQRSSPETFATLADAWVSALEGTFTPEMNLIIPEINSLSTTAQLSANTAVAASESAIAVTNAIIWVSGTTYSVGDARYSPITLLTYRRKIAGAGTIDPSLDTINWVSIGGASIAQLHAVALSF